MRGERGREARDDLELFVLSKVFPLTETGKTEYEIGWVGNRVMGVACFSMSNLRCLLDVQAEMSSRQCEYLILEFIRDVWFAGIDSGVTEGQEAGLARDEDKQKREECQ